MLNKVNFDYKTDRVTFESLKYGTLYQYNSIDPKGEVYMKISKPYDDTTSCNCVELRSGGLFRERTNKNLVFPLYDIPITITSSRTD